MLSGSFTQHHVNNDSSLVALGENVHTCVHRSLMLQSINKKGEKYGIVAHITISWTRLTSPTAGNYQLHSVLANKTLWTTTRVRYGDRTVCYLPKAVPFHQVEVHKYQVVCLCVWFTNSDCRKSMNPINELILKLIDGDDTMPVTILVEADVAIHTNNSSVLTKPKQL